MALPHPSPSTLTHRPAQHQPWASLWAAQAFMPPPHLSVLLTLKEGLMQTLQETQMAALESDGHNEGHDGIGKLVPKMKVCLTSCVF